MANCKSSSFFKFRVCLGIIDLIVLPFLQHNLLELVDDKVLADASDSVLAILLGVNAYDASGLLTFIQLCILFMKDTLRNEL